MLDLNSRPLITNKNIPHRPEVQRIGAPNHLNVTLPAQACSYEVCYQTKMLRNAAEIADRFCAKLNAFRCAMEDIDKRIQEALAIRVSVSDPCEEANSCLPRQEASNSAFRNAG